MVQGSIAGFGDTVSENVISSGAAQTRSFLQAQVYQYNTSGFGGLLPNI